MSSVMFVLGLLLPVRSMTFEADALIEKDLELSCLSVSETVVATSSQVAVAVTDSEGVEHSEDDPD